MLWDCVDPVLADLLIGVHCTHGVNRTGYMIGRYLVEQCGCTSHQALEGRRGSYAGREGEPTAAAIEGGKW